ncbi:hypothetical protein CCHR01_13258 [Colletotrichum chrysophilum]|uniref:Uncharacterized protein n=1 Tax=Colletotrichum chrysophilum TaxID=1836956 RepID=A0AAD9EAM9_9PEZI|nr:hypothetical protein CCHR01_13258 [Colletotrichum chrysophilum]
MSQLQTGPSPSQPRISLPPPNRTQPPSSLMLDLSQHAPPTPFSMRYSFESLPIYPPAGWLAGGHCKTCDTLADRSGHPQPLSGCKLKATGANQEHLTSHVMSFISSKARPPLADIRTRLVSCAIPSVVV